MLGLMLLKGNGSMNMHSNPWKTDNRNVNSATSLHGSRDLV